MFAKLFGMFDAQRAKRCINKSSYRSELQAMPGNLLDAWRASASREFPGIPQDAFFLVLHGLPGKAALIFRKKNALSR